MGSATSPAWGGAPSVLHEITPGASDVAIPLDINAAGAVTGVLRAGATSRAFRWTPASGMTSLPTPAGIAAARGEAINDAGDIAGGGLTAPSALAPRVLTWTASNQLVTLGVPPNRSGALALGIGASVFSVAGAGFGPPGVVGEAPFTFSLGAFTTPAPFPGVMTDLAADQTACGTLHTASGLRGARVSSGVVTTLGPLPGDTWSEAEAIGPTGIVVGTSARPGERRAVLWPAGVATAVDLGVLPGARAGMALGVNAAGDTVGVCETDEGHVATIWTTSTGPLDLNEQLSPADRAVWTLTHARGIDDMRRVIGVGFKRVGDVETLQGFRLDLGELVTPCPADFTADGTLDINDILTFAAAFSAAAMLPGPNDNRVLNGDFETPQPGDPTRPMHWARINNSQGRYAVGGASGAPPARSGSRLISVSGAPAGGFNSWNPVLNSAADHAPINADHPLVLEGWYFIPSQAPAFATSLFAAKIEFLALNPSGDLGPIVGSTPDLPITASRATTPGWVRFSSTIAATSIPPSARLARVLVFTFDGSGVGVAGSVYVDDVALFQAETLDPIADLSPDGVADINDVLVFAALFNQGCP